MKLKNVSCLKAQFSPVVFLSSNLMKWHGISKQCFKLLCSQETCKNVLSYKVKCESTLKKVLIAWTHWHVQTQFLNNALCTVSEYVGGQNKSPFHWTKWNVKCWLSAAKLYNPIKLSKCEFDLQVQKLTARPGKGAVLHKIHPYSFPPCPV